MTHALADVLIQPRGAWLAWVSLLALAQKALECEGLRRLQVDLVNTNISTLVVRVL